MTSLVNSTKHLGKKQYQFQRNSFEKLKRSPLNLFYEADIILNPKQDKDITSKENY